MVEFCRFSEWISSIMNKNDVPQDNNRTYAGHKKVIYAVNESGSYERVGSTGWEAEELATLMAVDDLNDKANAAYQRASNGESASLEYHMYSKRLDVLGLAQATGFFQWQIRRHLKPAIFAKLSEKKINTYAEVLGLTKAELKTLPANKEQPNQEQAQ
jgi:hypothetical protein